MMHKIVAVLAGLAAAFAVIFALDALVGQPYPEPAIDPFAQPDTYRQMVDSLPSTTFLPSLITDALGSLAAGITATLAYNRVNRWPSLVTAALLMVMGMVGVLAIYHPLWFRMASALVYLPFAYAGYRLARRRTPSTAPGG